MFGKASQSQTLSANKMLLEAPYLTDRVFSIHVPHFQAI